MESGMLRITMEPITEVVRDRYAKIAIQMRDGGGSCCDCDCGSAQAEVAVTGPTGEQLYPAESAQDAGVSLGVSLGCGNPTALADLHPGETVLDLGSGAGLDVLLSARRVSPGGHAYGVDMTDEMLRLSNENKERAGLENATFLKGTIDAVPLPDASVDVVISNCVINLAMDKRKVLREAFRVLRPGGRLAVADMVEVEPLPASVKASPEAWACCIAGTIPVDVYQKALSQAGFGEVSIEIIQTYSPGEAGLPEGSGKVASAAVRAAKP
jgi:arsenite methyltransferase